MHLNGSINHLQRYIRRDHFDLRNFTAGDFVPDRVHHVRRLERQQPRHVDLHSRVGNLVDIAPQSSQRFAERMTRQRTFTH